jgi:hypothetical protein
MTQALRLAIIATLLAAPLAEATCPYATDAPKLYDAEGNYRGRLSTNPYHPDSTSNPYGRYGSVIGNPIIPTRQAT